MNVTRFSCSVIFAATVIACTASNALADDQGAVKKVCAVPILMFGAAAGIVVGTPIAAARMSGKDMKAIYHEYDDDTFSWKLWGRPLAIPVGILEGAIKGCIIGPKNAIRYANKPFSKEAFSLEDLD